MLYCDRFARLFFVLGYMRGFVITNSAQAQIIPDDSLGSESSVVTPNVTIKDSSADLIEGGAVRDSNLFHSFSDFNVDNGSAVYFASPEGINNILTRVTGNNVSNIFGKLGVNGAANLFLLNPNGIVFGENANLDVNGSFLATTADSYIFDNDFAYSASNPKIPPLLTINLPVGLQMGDNPGDIEVKGTGHNLGLNNFTFAPIRDNRSVGLEIKSGNTLALLGGEINLTGGNLTAEAARVELGSVTEAETIDLNSTDDGFTFDYGETNNFGNINLTQAASIEVSGSGGGNIQLQGKNISVLENSAIIANTLGADDGGTLDIIASESVKIIGTDEGLFPSAIFTQIEAGATGNSNALNIDTNNLEIANNAFVSHSVAGMRDARDVTFNANTIEVTGSLFPTFYATGIFSQTLFGSTGNGGDLTFNAENFQVTNGGQISTGTVTSGNAGNLTINSESIEIGGTTSNGLSSTLSTNVNFPEATGKGGDLTINGDRLLVRDGGQIGSGTVGVGDGGNLTINVKEIEIRDPLSNSGLYSGVNFSEATGKGGDLTINSDRLIIDSGLIVSGTLGINDAGDLNINTPELSVLNGGKITSETRGGGNAGNLDIQAKTIAASGKNSFDLSSLISSSVNFPSATGQGGRVNIQTETLNLADGAQIEVATFGMGDGGNLFINASESIEINGINNFIIPEGEAQIFSGGLFASVQNTGTGDGGNLTIETPKLQVLNGGQISASTLGQGNAGNLTIKASDIEVNGVVLSHLDTLSGIVANVEPNATGNGGNLIIESDNLSVLNGGQISASSFGDGDAGNVSIKAQNIQATGKSPDGFLSGIYALAEKKSTGNGGSINVIAGDISLENGAKIASDTFGDGDAGNLDLTANSLKMGRGTIVSSDTFGRGNAGNVNLTATNLTILDGAHIGTVSFGENSGNGGNLRVVAETIEIQGVDTETGFSSSILASVEDGSIANSGKIAIETNNLNLSDGAKISVSNLSSGNSGNLSINANELNLDNSAKIEAEVDRGSRGNIYLATNNIFLNNSQITVRATGMATGGNIEIDNTENIVLIENSQIMANAVQGNGGNVEIMTQGYFISADSFVSASSEFGLDGDIAVETIDGDRKFESGKLPKKTIRGNQQMIASCGIGANQFAISGKGGLPNNPTQSIRGQAVWQDMRIPTILGNTSNLSAESGSISHESIVEATSWQVNYQGQIELVAVASNNSRLDFNNQNCKSS